MTLSKIISIGVLVVFFIGLYLIGLYLVDKAEDTLNKRWQKKKGIKS